MDRAPTVGPGGIPLQHLGSIARLLHTPVVLKVPSPERCRRRVPTQSTIPKQGLLPDDHRPRSVCSLIHTWPPGKAHGSHHHSSWEQVYYIFAGQAEITVADEKKIVGPGSSAFMPPNIEHDIVAVGDETLVAAVVTCHLDDDKINEPN